MFADADIPLVSCKEHSRLVGAEKGMTHCLKLPKNINKIYTSLLSYNVVCVKHQLIGLCSIILVAHYSLYIGVPVEIFWGVLEGLDDSLLLQLVLCSDGFLS